MEAIKKVFETKNNSVRSVLLFTPAPLMKCTDKSGPGHLRDRRVPEG